MLGHLLLVLGECGGGGRTGVQVTQGKDACCFVWMGM
jgi:hypothetical protein